MVWWCFKNPFPVFGQKSCFHFPTIVNKMEQCLLLYRSFFFFNRNSSDDISFPGCLTATRALLPWRKGARPVPAEACPLRRPGGTELGGPELGGPGVRADTVPQPATGRGRAERARSAPRSDGRGFCYAILKPGVPKSFVDKIEEWLSFSLVHKLQ